MSIKAPSEIGQYIFAENIGHGGFSTVFQAVHLPTKESVAIKMIPKDNFPFDKFQRELEIMKSLDHPFCAAFFEFLEDEDNYYLVMEHLEGGNLFRLVNAVGALPEWKCRHYFCQLICALDYLHTELQIAHRDLKVENIMLDRNDNVRLIDFGLGNMFQGDNVVLSTACGSPAYAPPEMLRGKPYTTTADVWSAGIVLYAISIGRLPFEGTNIQNLVIKIVTEEPNYPETLPPNLIDLIRRMLIKDPQLRITIPKIIEHPWFQQYYAPEKMRGSFGLTERFRSPAGHFVLNDDVVKILEKLEIDVPQTIESVSKHSFDSIAASYRIIARKMMTASLRGLSEAAFSFNENPMARTSLAASTGAAAQFRRRSTILDRSKIPRPIAITPHFKATQPIGVEPKTGVTQIAAMQIVTRHNPLSATRNQHQRTRSTSFTTPVKNSIQGNSD